jgi:hypothetical protein
MFAPQGEREQGSASIGPAAGVLMFGEAEPATDGARVPVYLRANQELNLSALSFAMGIEGSAATLHFAPVDAVAPTLLDNALPGVLAMAWFNKLLVASGHSLLLGYAELSGANAAAISLRGFGLQANAGQDGHAVLLSFPAFQPTKPRNDTQ